MSDLKVILIHGNGRSTPNDNWLPYVKAELEKHKINVIVPQFPDAPIGREAYWIPFLHDLQVDEHTILVGHSTGAIASMRFAEHNKILGSILIGAYTTDLGMDSEKASGYFDRPWNWHAIKNNQQWIVLFASSDDPWIPIEEPRRIHHELKTEYYEFKDKGHFGGDYYKPEFPELVKILRDKAILRKR